MSCAQALGNEKLMAVMPDFLARYPAVEVDLRLGDDYIDLIAEGIDVAIRGGVLKDSSLRARRIGSSERIYVASSAYLQQHGVPAQPKDLLQHECIIYSLMAAGSTGWPFKDGDVHVRGRLRINNLEGIRRAVLQGVGIGYLPSWMVAGELQSGALQALLTEHAGERTPLNALYSAQRLLPQRAAVFIDYIAAVFGDMPGLNGTSLV